MATTYTLIASSTVGSGGAANIEFTSIPATYTDLLIKVSVRTTNGGSRDDFKITINGDTGSNYSAIRVFGIDQSVSSQSSSGTPSDLNIGSFVGDGATNDVFSSTHFYIACYAENYIKNISCDWCAENNSTTAFVLGMSIISWLNTNAITSFKIESKAANNLKQYSTAYLYGIKNS